MRFARIDIPAYGPFTDLIMEMPRGDSDFHLVYGPNEAGKSSLMRAVQAMLFGIHGQTSDNFMHDYNRLLVGARLERDGGTPLDFRRRKGQKGTLLSPEGEMLDDDALRPFLGNVSRDYFERMFMLNAARLRHGAMDILASAGDVGEALFAASTASGAVHGVLTGLREETDALYRPRASTTVIARLLKEHKSATAKMNAAISPPRAWKQAVQKLAEADAELEAKTVALAEARARLESLGLASEALPLLASLDEIETALGNLPELPDLDATFVEQASEALEARVRARADRDREASRVKTQVQRLAGLAPREDVLAQAAGIAEIASAQGRQADLANSLGAQRANLDTIEKALREGLHELGMDPNAIKQAGFQVSAPDLHAFEALGEKREQAARRLAEHTAELTGKQAEVAQHNDELKALPEVEADRYGAVLEATRVLEDDNLVTLAVREGETVNGRDLALRRLQVCPGAEALDAEAMAALAPPVPATLDEHDTERRTLRGAVERADADLERLRERYKTAEAQLKALTRGGDLPSPDDLVQARRNRDDLWQRVQSAWRTGTDEGGDERPLDVLLTEAIVLADDVVDRMREDAESVARATNLREELEKLQREGEETSERVETCGADLAAWAARWKACWSGTELDPLTPAEMKDWLRAWDDYCRRDEAWREAATAHTIARETAKRHVALLRKQLPDADPDLSAEDLRTQLVALARRENNIAGERHRIERERDRVRSRLEELQRITPELEGATEVASAAYTARCKELGLPANVGTRAASQLLTKRNELARSQRTRDDTASEVQRMEQAMAAHEARANEVANALGVETGSLADRVAALTRLRGDVLSLMAQRQEAEQQLVRDRGQLRTCEEALAEAERRVEDARSRAGSANDAELQDRLGHLRTRHGLDARQRETRQALLEKARGKALDDYVAELRTLDPGTVQTECQALEEQVALFDTERTDAVRRHQDATRDRDALARSDTQAAAHRQMLELAATGLRESAARYIRLQLAAQFLARQIEQFREDNQAPLVERASSLFATVTGGMFEGLAIEYEDDKPQLRGVRDGQRLDASELSDGTLDQLYLALRMAAIEHHVRGDRPIPLLLDDLLQSSDEARSMGLVTTLRQLGQHTQVLLFTHHAWLRDAAREAVGDAAATHVHDLPPREARVA